ncbi:MAG: hypothetical protein VX320_03350, partial [Candidatus Thermoplasmatota archaeon]|nr:hypothetical protein [Candidatus Thermoplasmatota archaeon]
RARGKWSEEGRSLELDRLLNRLDLIDDSLILASPRISEMIEEVAPWRNIEPVLEELKLRSTRRTEAMNGMVSVLKGRGWDVTELTQGAMHERFAAADKLQQLDSRLKRCQRQIEIEIRPFDNRTAERLWQAAEIVQRDAEEESMLEIEREIEEVMLNLSRRLAIVEEQLTEWKNDGFNISISIPLLPGEMLEWEVQLPLIAERVEAVLAMRAQMEPHLEQWPEYRQLAERAWMHLDAIDSLEVLLEGLEAKTKSAVATCQARLDSWGSFGIDTSYWAPLIESEPRAVLEELDMHQSLISLIIPLIEELESLDTSIRGHVEVDNWLQELRNNSAGISQIEEVSAWLNIASIRDARHREHLDEVRAELATLWPDGVESESLSLHEYDNMISSIESGGSQYADGVKNLTSGDSNIKRVKRRVESELDSWSLLGWSVDGLRELLVKDPVRLGLDLPDIRVAMSTHNERIARFEPLPWGLNVELAEQVLSDMSRPERLPALDSDSTKIVKQLSVRAGSKVSDFVFSPFRPSPPRAKIVRKIPVLKPVEGVVENRGDLEDVPIHDKETIEKIQIKEEIGMIVSNSDGEVILEEELEPESEVILDDEFEKVGGLSTELRDMFGLESNEDSWLKLVTEPLDVRVQRLVRLAILLGRGDTEEHRSLQRKLLRVGKKLEAWTAERLSWRRASSGNGLLMDAKDLGARLAEIPGPGTFIPVSTDTFSLPNEDNLVGLSTAISRLEKAVYLPSAKAPVLKQVEA